MLHLITGRPGSYKRKSRAVSGYCWLYRRWYNFFKLSKLKSCLVAAKEAKSRESPSLAHGNSLTGLNVCIVRKRTSGESNWIGTHLDMKDRHLLLPRNRKKNHPLRVPIFAKNQIAPRSVLVLFIRETLKHTGNVIMTRHIENLFAPDAAKVSPRQVLWKDMNVVTLVVVDGTKSNHLTKPDCTQVQTVLFRTTHHPR